MANRGGNYYCDVCGKPILYIGSAETRSIGQDLYTLCSGACTAQFEKEYKVASDKMQKALQTLGDEDARQGLDTKPGWKMHRWWNQTYKRKKDVWEQRKVDREFKRIQRRARRGG